MQRTNSASLYIHIPFCHTLCTYCTFNTYAGMDSLIPAYVDAVTEDLRSAGDHEPAASARTLYFGGGTPSMLSPDQVEQIIQAACKHLKLQTDAEITLEANPDSVNLTSLRGYKKAGVNRLSLGVQSAYPEDLRLFGRRHTFQDARRAFETARTARFTDISIDLMYGAMGQTMASWQQTIDQVLAWEPDHFSVYCLILEPGTSLYKRVEKNSLPTPDADLAADMYDYLVDKLAAEDYVHYEISSWGRVGYQSQHNRTYWRNEPFYGVGAGAHGAVRNGSDRMIRYWKIASIQDYITSIRQNTSNADNLGPAVAGCEHIGTELEMSETAILNLRMLEEGIDRQGFLERFGQPLDNVFGAEIETMVESGLLRDDGKRVRLTRRAYLLSNQVFVHLLP